MDRTPDEFAAYLESTLIPDLKESGNEAIAEDLEESVRIIRMLCDNIIELRLILRRKQ